MVTNQGLFVLLAFLCLTAVHAEDQHKSILGQVSQYYSYRGGYTNTLEDTQPKLGSTAAAVWLYSVNGRKQDINAASVTQFIESALVNADGGFSDIEDGPSSAEATSDALETYHLLGVSVPEVEKVGAFINSLYDAKTGLFASHAGESGSLSGTAAALRALPYLAETEGTNLKKKFSAISSAIKGALKDGDHFSAAGVDDVSATFSGVYAGVKVGVEFNAKKIASFVQQRQQKDGSFGSLEATAKAVTTLRLLGNSGKVDLISQLDTEALYTYARAAPEDLVGARNAHLVVFLGGRYKELFETSVSLEVLDDTLLPESGIIQGTQIKPVLTVNTLGVLIPGSLDISVSIRKSGKELQSSKLLFNQDSQQYIAEEFFDSSSHLGPIEFVFTLGQEIADYGAVSYSFSESRTVGFGYVCDSAANLAGKEIQEGETVGIGAEFSFKVNLFTKAEPSITKGDFVVNFRVEDSAAVPIHESSLDCSTNTKPVEFSYSLKASNLPAGALVFRFAVKGKDGAVHTEWSVSYALSIPMIASDIKFNAKDASHTYKLGDKVSISMAPASLPDLRTVHTYDASPRRFAVEVSTVGGVLLFSIDGKQTKSLVTFDFPISPVFEAFGTNIVTFVYRPAVGADIKLSNYDSALGELYDDASLLNYTVTGELHLAEVKSLPKGGDLTYGSEMEYRFKVKDIVSGQSVKLGSAEQAGVLLSLRHEGERTFTSSQISASQADGAEFIIQWAVDPNAVKGPGSLVLSAQDADGKTLPLYGEGNKQAVVSKVTIGGDIEVDVHSFTTSDRVDISESAFVVDFELKCKGKPLKSALLYSVVSVEAEGSEKVLFERLHVATGDNGAYQTSWTLPAQSAPSGKYAVKVYREVDKDTAGAKPLFSTTVDYTSPSRATFPIRTEFFIAMSLLLGFVGVSYQREQYMNEGK